MQVEQWLEREVGINAADILRRMIRFPPETYHEGQLCSMERRGKKWRAVRAEQLLGAMREAGKRKPS